MYIHSTDLVELDGAVERDVQGGSQSLGDGSICLGGVEKGSAVIFDGIREEASNTL